MALTRQNGTASGCIRFFPANPKIDASELMSNGEFVLEIMVNVKDAKGQAVSAQEIKFSVDNAPDWLNMPNAFANTNSSGNALLIIKGRIKGNSENGYVSFKLSNTNTPERSGSGMIAFTGTKPSGMKRLFFF